MRNSNLYLRSCFCFRAGIVAAFITCLMATGCATKPSYKPLASSPDQAATIRGRFKGFIPSWYKLTLQAVDGQRVKVDWWETDWHEPILVDSGNHRLTVLCQYNATFRSGYCYGEVNAWLKAGHRYQLCCEREHDELTFWLEDSVSRQIASERTPARGHSQSDFQLSGEVAVELTVRLTLAVFSLGVIH